MPTTLLDPRIALWERRKIEQERLATFREFRSSICGLSCCNDADKAAELDREITQCLARIAKLNDRIAVHASLEGEPH